MMAWNVQARWRSLLPPLMAIILGLAAYWPWWWPWAPAPGLDDLSQINAPQRVLLGWFYRHGWLPLWNPWSFGGQPFLAAGQSGPWYPPNLIFALLPIVPALKVSYTVHVMWGALGAYLLLRRWSGARGPSVMGTVAWLIGAPLFQHQIHTQMWQAAMWLPWIGWALESAWDGRRRGLIVLPICIAMEILAGHPQVSFMAALQCLAQCIIRRWMDEAQPWREWLKLIGAGLWGVLMAAVQWMPTADLAVYSNRMGAAAWFLLEGSLAPWTLLQWLIPLPFGGGYTGQPYAWLESWSWLGDNFWEVGAYFGIVTLVLAAAAAVQTAAHALGRLPSSTRQPLNAGDRRLLGLCLAGILFVLLALGGYGPLTPVLTHVPGFDFFRDPGRYMLTASLFLAGTAAAGCARWLGQPREADHGRRLVAGCAAAAGLAVIALHVLRYPTPTMPSWAWIIPALWCLGVVLTALPASLSADFRVRAWCLLGVADAGLWGGSFASFVFWAPAEYVKPTPVQKYLQQHLPADTPWVRAASLDTGSVSQDKGLTWRIPMLNGEDSLVPAWYAAYADLQWGDQTFLAQPRSTADAWGVEYIVTDNSTPPFSVGSTGPTAWTGEFPADKGPVDLVFTFNVPWSVNASNVLILVRSGSTTHAFRTSVSQSVPTVDVRVEAQGEPLQITVENDNWTGWMWLESVEVKGEGTSLERHPWARLEAPSWTPVLRTAHETVWRNPDTVLPGWVSADTSVPLPQTAVGQAQSTAWTPTRQVWQVTGPGGVLVVSQTYDPSWTATVDGHPASVEAALGFLTAVRVPAGTHTVTLTYRFPALRSGLWTSGSALAGWLYVAGGVTSRRWRARRRV